MAVYFDRRHKDLKLLLNLLAETSGLPESFRILTLFDKKFQSLWKPQNLRFEEYETVLPNRTVKSRSIIVRWNDAPIGHFLSNYNSNLAFEYTIGKFLKSMYGSIVFPSKSFCWDRRSYRTFSHISWVLLRWILLTTLVNPWYCYYRVRHFNCHSLTTVLLL